MEIISYHLPSPNCCLPQPHVNHDTMHYIHVHVRVSVNEPSGSICTEKSLNFLAQELQGKAPICNITPEISTPLQKNNNI